MKSAAAVRLNRLSSSVRQDCQPVRRSSCGQEYGTLLVSERIMDQWCRTDCPALCARTASLCEELLGARVWDFIGQ
jgi:hypothetical protein